MMMIKGNPVQGAEEYELLYFQGNGLDYCSNSAQYLNLDVVIDENNNLVVETPKGFAWSNFELQTNCFRVPYAYKVVGYYNDENGLSHIIWSQDLNADNSYIVDLTTEFYEYCLEYTLAVAVCWKYADLYYPDAQIEFGEWLQCSTSDVIDFEIADEGIYAVRAHGTGYDSSDLSNCVEYRI